MTDTPTLNTRPTRWVWLGYPAETVPTLDLTGWPASLNGETVTLTIDDTPLTAVIASEVAAFTDVVLPAVSDTYDLTLSIGAAPVEVFAHGRLSIQESGTSSFADASFDVHAAGITFELAVSVRGASAAQVALLDAVVAGLAAHIVDAVAAHAAGAISVNVAGITATDVNAAVAELLDTIVALPALVDGLTTRVDDSTPGVLRVEQLVRVLNGLPASNTVAEVTTFAPSPFIFAAGTIQMGSTLLSVAGSGELRNNTGADRTATLRVKVADTTVASYTTPAIPSDATNRPISVELLLTTLTFGSDFIVPAVALVSVGAPGGVGAPLVDRQPMTLANAVIDPDLDTDFDITVQLSFAGGQLSFSWGRLLVDQVEPVVWAG